MNLKIPVVVILLFCSFFNVFSQTKNFAGKVVDANGKPIPNATILLPGSGVSTVTNESGEFNLKENASGRDTGKIASNPEMNSMESPDTQVVAIDSARVLEQRNIHADTENIPTISADDERTQSSTPASENVASVLNSSRDAFNNAVSFNLSIARFRVRGYEDDNFVTLMNGVPMSDLASGRLLFSTWSGLNDAMRNRESTTGLAASYYTFGEIGGSVNIDSRASRQRKQLQVTYSLANRTYDNRIMLTYGSGILKNGWSYAVSYSRRWANEGYVNGTYYDGHSYFAAVEKQIGSKHSLALTAMGAPTENGRGRSSYEEMYDLAGSHYYNPNWGYQSGKVRNSSVGRSHQPLVTLTYHWDISNRSSLHAAAGYSFGYYRVSSLDWFNAIDPRPDYYRSLPSFDPNYAEDPAAFIPYAEQLTVLLRNNEEARQLNWDALYEANMLHDTTYGNTRGYLAKYVVQDYVTDYDRYSFNAYYNTIVDDRTKLSLGYSFQSQRSEYYKELTDLLGADFYVDLNQFVDLNNPSEISIQQNDLNNPDRVLHEGDKYGYHYIANVRKHMMWGQIQFSFDHFDYMLAVQLGMTTMNRDGLTRNGIYPQDSYGKSHTFSYENVAVKGGITYKLNGRNYFFANGAFETRPPYFDDLFLSPRSNNRVVNADDMYVTSFEGGYLLKAPRVKGRLTGFYTQFTDETQTLRYYSEEYHTFVNYSMTGMNKRHEGVEGALEVNFGRGFTGTAVVSVGQYFYTSRPNAYITEDSKDNLLTQSETIYLKNVRLSTGPQQAYSLGVNYRSPQFWFIYMNVNFFDGIYYDASFARRQIQSLDLVDAGSAKWNEIINQKQSFNGYSLDLSAGWSWKLDNQFKSLKRPVFLLFSVGVTNLTNNQDIVVRAAEPLRFDFANKDVNKFAPRITYAYGRTYFLNLILRMN